MERHIYDIWLQKALNVRSKRVKAIIALFGSSKNIYEANENILRNSGIFSTKETERLSDKDLSEAQRIYRMAVENDIAVISFNDKEYPEMLRQIVEPPFVLYVKGTLPSWEGLKVAVVGTRSPTDTGIQTAFSFSYGLAENHAMVISGGAEGIDAQAHLGALQAGGITVCVLGYGILYPYDAGGAAMRSEIARSGVLISEYPPDAKAERYSFPDRNRLIAGLADCTLVVEAGVNSGALITAGMTAAQNKPLFAVPGSLDNPEAVGTNNLLRMGAAITTQYQDLLTWYDSGLRTAANMGQKMTEADIKKMRSSKIPLPVGYPKNTPPAVAQDLSQQTEKQPAPVKKKRRRRASSEKTAAGQTPPIPSENAAVLPADEMPAEKSGKDAETISPIMTEKPPEEKKKTVKTDKIPADLLTAEVKSVYDTISEGSKDAETIHMILGMSVSEVMSALTELELLGLIKSVAFGQYERI